MARSDQRLPGDLRHLMMTPGFAKYSEGSCLIELGNTKVICTATVEEKQPPWMAGKPSGWVTGEYGMLPRATSQRTQREATRGHQGGRTQEIQRLIGRSLRTVTDLAALGPRTVILDCDVIQADGGTRTASVTGAYVALVCALDHLRKKGVLKQLPLKDQVAATSVGIIEQEPVLDLNYEEDFKARVDMNVVMTGRGQFIEVQGTGEGGSFSEIELNKMLGLARAGVLRLIQLQKTTLQQFLGPSNFPIS